MCMSGVMAKKGIIDRLLGKTRNPIILDPSLQQLSDAEAGSIEVADSGREINQQVSELNGAIQNLNDQLVDNEVSENDFEAQIVETENRLAELRTELLSITNQKRNLENQLESTVADLQSSEEQLESAMRRFTDANENLKMARQLWKGAIEDSRYPNGPDAGPIPIAEQLPKFNRVSFLGDVHGWAPGLIHAMQDLGIGNVSIAGWDLGDADAMNAVFPNNLERTRKQLPLAKVGLDGHPWKPSAPPTRYLGIGWSPNIEATDALIQVGDLFDRGDYGDVVLEIMRQAVIAEPGRVSFIVGNHEVWIIEDNSAVWVKNEANYVMQPNARTPGVCYHDPLMTGIDDYDASMMAGFRVLEGGLGALLLAHFVAFHDALPEDQKEVYLSQFEEAIQSLPLKLKDLHKLVHRGGWKLHEVGRQALEGWRKKSHSGPIAIPGAFVMLGIGGVLTAHAEANGMVSDDVDLSPIEMKWDISGNEVNWIPLVLDKGKAVNRALYEARTEREMNGWEKSIQVGLERLNQHVNFDTYVHGHSVRPMPDVHEFTLEDESRVVVAGIDEGMAPHYRHRVEDDAMNPNRRAKLFQQSL